MYTEIWAPRSMSQPSTERNSTIPSPAFFFFVGRWLLAEPPEIRMHWFAFVSLLLWKLNWTPWNFLGFLLELEKCHASLVTPMTHVHRDFSTTFHVTTQHWEKQHHFVTSLFLSVVGCLLNRRKCGCSDLLLSAFFCGNWTERRETSLGFCWS